MRKMWIATWRDRQSNEWLDQRSQWWMNVRRLWMLESVATCWRYHTDLDRATKKPNDGKICKDRSLRGWCVGNTTCFTGDIAWLSIEGSAPRSGCYDIATYIYQADEDEDEDEQGLEKKDWTPGCRRTWSDRCLFFSVVTVEFSWKVLSSIIIILCLTHGEGMRMRELGKKNDDGWQLIGKRHWQTRDVGGEREAHSCITTPCTEYEMPFSTLPTAVAHLSCRQSTPWLDLGCCKDGWKIDDGSNQSASLTILLGD